MSFSANKNNILPEFCRKESRITSLEKVYDVMKRDKLYPNSKLSLPNKTEVRSSHSVVRRAEFVDSYKEYFHQKVTYIISNIDIKRQQNSLANAIKTQMCDQGILVCGNFGILKQRNRYYYVIDFRKNFVVSFDNVDEISTWFIKNLNRNYCNFIILNFSYKNQSRKKVFVPSDKISDDCDDNDDVIIKDDIVIDDEKKVEQKKPTTKKKVVKKSRKRKRQEKDSDTPPIEENSSKKKRPSRKRPKKRRKLKNDK